MRWGTVEGFHTFDLAGVAHGPQTAKEAGIMRFKAKLGGRCVECWTHRKVFRPFACQFHDDLRRWKRL